MAYNTANLLLDRSGKPIPQIYDPSSDKYIPLTVDIYRKVSDADVKAALEELKNTIPRNYVGNSIDTKPNGKEGDSFVEIDTGKVFLHDGSKWREF